MSDLKVSLVLSAVDRASPQVKRLAGELERLAREQAKAKQAKQAKQAERANARAWVLGIGLVLGLIALVILAQGGVV